MQLKMKYKRFLSLLMAFAMMLTLLPMSAFATVAEGETTVPDLPKAKAKVLDCTNSETPLTFALHFSVDTEGMSPELQEEVFKYYKDYYVDFKLTVSGLTDGPVIFDGNDESADGYLAGQYAYTLDEWYDGDWMKVPFVPYPMQNGGSIEIMKYAAEEFNAPGLLQTVESIATVVQNFNCGVYFKQDFLEKNPDLEVKLDLNIYPAAPDGENAPYGEPINLGSYTFTQADIAVEKNNNYSVEIPSYIIDKVEGGANADSVQEIIDQIQNNSAEMTYTPEGTSVKSLDVTLSGLVVSDSDGVDKLIYTVTPKNAEGNKVSTPEQSITFRLPIPASVTAESVNVYHNGVLMPESPYEVEGSAGGKYIEVTSATFSEFAIVPVGESTLSGAGTATDPYRINNLDDLKSFRDDVNSGYTYEGEYVKLNADINLTDVAWTPIGTSNYDKTPTTEGVKMFAGNFDGGNHTITGLSSDGYVPNAAETGSTEYSFGLFGYVNGANISNVNLANVDINCGTRTDSAGNEVYGSGIAALIGYYVPENEATTVIENCHVLSGTVKASNNMGGLIGHMDSQLSQPKVDITIRNCSNAADVTTEAREAGGILGLMNSARKGNYNVTMRGTVAFVDCVNTGDITSLGGGAPSAGGILGRDHNQAAGQRLKIVFDGCENSGKITVTANGETHAAGIGAGYYSAGAWLIAKDCTNTGDVVVNGSGDVYAGGLISYGGVVELINSTSTGTVTGGVGNKYVGGAQSILFLEKMNNFTDTVNGYTYYLNGGTSPEYAALVDDAAGGGNFHLVETAYRDGSNFLGWYDNPEFNGEAYTALNKSVKTYYAKWDVKNVAKIGGTYYETLQDAIDAAGAGDTDTITLLTDLTIASDLNNAGKGYFNIADGKKVTIDLNGKTINATDNSTGNFILFYSYGNLTIKNGTVNLTATNDRDWNAESAIVLNRGGVLTIEDGTYTHKGGTDMAFVVDNSGNWYGEATANIQNGALTSTYVAIRNRMEQNSHGASGAAILNVSGGTISGTSRAIWAQAASTSTTAPATGEINVSGGTVGLIDTPRSNGAVSMTTISGGTVDAFKGEVGELTVTSSGTAPKTITMMNDAGEEVAYTVTADGKYVAAAAKIGTQSYETLAAAIEAAQDGDTIKLLSDITLDTMIVNTKKVTLDLNGKTITGTDNTSKNFSLIDNRGELTITGDGKMTLTATVNSGWNRYSAVIANNPGGKLVIESGTIEHLGGTDMAYGIDNLTNGKGTYAETIINGGTIEGANKSIWMQDPNKNANTGKLTVSEDATLNGDVYLFVTAGSTEWPVEVSIAASAVTGEVITGNVPEGYALVETNGAYGVIKQTKVTVTVNDATKVEGNADPEFSYTTDVEGVPALDITYTVDGTTINATVAEMEGYEFTVVPGTLTIEKALVRVYAKNNANVKYFADLKEAVEFAVAQKGNIPVYLLGNVTVDETIVINDTNAGLVELQGDQTGIRTYTITSTHSGELFKVEKGTLAVKNLKINAQGDAFYVTGGILNLNYHSQGKQFIEVTSQTGNCVYVRGGSVNVNGAKLTSLGEYPAIQGNGNYVGNVTLNRWNIGDGTYPEISAPNTDIAIYWPGNGKLTVEGGKITGDTALYAKSGTIVIKGGEFIGNGAAKAYEPYGNGAHATGDAVVIETSTDAAYETPSVSIIGGTFTSANAQSIAVYGDGTAIEKFITGGTTNKPVELKYCADGYASVYENGVYVVRECVAIVGNLGYMSLGEAVAAATDDQTVILMKNVDLAGEKIVTLDGKYNTYFLVDGKTVTINLNGKTISGNYTGDSMLVGVFSTDNGGNLTLTGNGTVDVTATSTVYGLVVNYEPGCYTTIENGTYTLDKASDSLIYTGGDESVTVQGGTFTLGNVGTGENGSPWIFNAKGQNTANVTVTGGTFNANVALQYYAHEVDIEDGNGNLSYITDNKDGTWIVSGKPAEVAILTDVAGNYDLALGYATFKDAVAAIAKGAPETTIVLQKDITVKGQFIGHSYAQDVVIDLNGHKMSSTDKALTVYRGGTEVTVKNGTIHGNTTGGTIQVTYGGKLTLGEDVTITSGGQATAIKVDANSTLVVDKDTSYVLGGKNDLVVADKATVEISAGYFKKPVDAAWCAEGYIPTEKLENGYYSVEKDPAYGMAAQIDDQYYETLAGAITAAKDDDIITVLADVSVDKDDAVALDDYATIFNVAGKSITIDLNGKTISGDFEDLEKMLIGIFSTSSNGHLTLTGNGTVTANANGANVYALLVNYDADASITIEGGNYILNEASDCLIYSAASANEGQPDANGVYTGVIVKGGTFELGNVGDNGKAGNYGPWIFNVKGQNHRHTWVTGGTFNADINHQYWTFEAQLPETLAVQANGDGTWTVVDAVAYVTESHGAYTKNVGYATLEEAIAGAYGEYRSETYYKQPKANEQVVLLKDIVLKDTLTIENGKTVVLNLNGKTISQTKECTAHYEMIKNSGNLTITGNGTVSFTDTSAGDPDFGWGSYTVGNYGTLVVDNATIKNLSQQNTATAVNHMYCAIQQGHGAVSTTIQGENTVISNPTYRSVRVNTGALVIAGGDFEGQVWAQPNQGNVSIQISGGSFRPSGADGSSVFMTNAGEKYTVTAKITDGSFATKIGCSDPEALAGCITGGTFTEAAQKGTNSKLFAN